jgi:hypothetical protein
MACLQTSAGNGGPGIRPTYATEAACLEACKEGACCEGTTCSVKPQCQCQGAGETFKGVGTTCNPDPCKCCENNLPTSDDCQWCFCFCGNGLFPWPRFVNVTVFGEYRLIKPNVVNGVLGNPQFLETYKSLSATVTLSAQSSPTRTNCPYWTFEGTVNGVFIGVQLNWSRVQSTIGFQAQVGVSDTAGEYKTAIGGDGFVVIGIQAGPAPLSGPFSSVCLNTLVGVTWQDDPVAVGPTWCGITVNGVQP